MYGRGHLASSALVARITRAIDRGHSYGSIANADPHGCLSQETVGRAMRGQPITDRTERGIIRALDAVEATFPRVRVRVQEAAPPVKAPIQEAPKEVPENKAPERHLPPELWLGLVVGLLEQVETVCLTWDHPRRNHVLALLNAAKEAAL